ncbi:Hypothetical predicted protein [Olea europaea subsp. europaea]|uniref:Transmembrane protein n=1 Tax=Olea europaea subsp. europaea TaxID=158383 RepID=A0A8S0T2F2_OLEEU|nr:Hypothetical predicted protein [Olea europaea subsp. europaea]
MLKFVWWSVQQGVGSPSDSGLDLIRTTVVLGFSVQLLVIAGFLLSLLFAGFPFALQFGVLRLRATLLCSWSVLGFLEDLDSAVSWCFFAVGFLFFQHPWSSRDFEIGQTSHQLPGRFYVILCLAVSYLWFFATLVYYLQVVGGCPVDCRFGPGSWGFWSGSRPFIVPETGPLFFVWLLDFWASIQLDSSKGAPVKIGNAGNGVLPPNSQHSLAETAASSGTKTAQQCVGVNVTAGQPSNLNSGQSQLPILAEQQGDGFEQQEPPFLEKKIEADDFHPTGESVMISLKTTKKRGG